MHGKHRNICKTHDVGLITLGAKAYSTPGWRIIFLNLWSIQQSARKRQMQMKGWRVITCVALSLLLLLFSLSLLLLLLFTQD